MAPLFQRRSLLIRDDEPDYSVRATFSTHAGSGGAVIYSPPPIRSAAPPQAPSLPAAAPKPRRAPLEMKRRLLDLTDQARDLSRQLTDAGRSRIATLASRLARNVAPSDQFAEAMTSPAAARLRSLAERRAPVILSEEQRWQEYEAAHREDAMLHDETSLQSSPADVNESDLYDASPFPSSDPGAEILRMRAERVLTEMSETAPDEPASLEEPAAPSNGEANPAPAMEPQTTTSARGKYVALVGQLNDGTPHNWNGTSEEPAMREEHVQTAATTSDTNGRARSVTLDSDNNTINITKESKFSGQLKFSGTLVVDGEVEGELEAVRVIIREGGKASARISGDSIVISGKVTGDVIARRELEMAASGKLTGDIMTPELKLHPGAMFKGRCSVGERA